MESSEVNTLQHTALPQVEAYTAFLMQQYLQEYTDEYIRLLEENGIDTLAYFPPEKHKTVNQQFTDDAYSQLSLLADGRWYEQIQTVLGQVIPLGTDTASQLKVKTERLLLIAYLRKKAYNHFIGHYTQDVTTALALIGEIDHYSVVFEKSVNHAYLSNISGLLESREVLYKEAQSIARMGNWSFNIESGNIQYSEEVSNICCLNELDGQLSIHKIKSLLQPEDWTEIWHKYFELKHTGKPLFYIATIRLPNGEERIVELKARNARDAENARQIVGTVQDVTIEQGMIRNMRENERLYRHSEAMTNIGSWTINLITNKTTFSEGLFRIYEIEPHTGNVDMTGPRSYADAADRLKIDYHAAKCKEDGTRYELQYRITLPGGHRKLLHCIGEAMYDSNGTRYALIGTIRDITLQHEMIHQLRQKELLYRQAQTIGRIGNWVNDLVTGKTEWSEELYHIFEVDPTRKGVRRQAIDRVMVPDKTILEAHLKRCRENGTAFDFQFRMKMPGGDIRHFRSKGETVRSEEGLLLQMIGTVQDITEQIMVEVRLREHQRFTQKITDIAPTLIAVYDINTGVYAFVSLAVEKILGYKREEILEQGLPMLLEKIHPDDKEQLLKEQMAAVDRANSEDWDGIEEFKYRMRHKDGTYRWLQTFGTIFQRNEEGKITQVLNISIDITGEKQAEQILNQKNMLLQQSNSSLEEFAYIASHDLQEPLRKISTFGNMLQTLQEDNLSDSGKLYLRKIVDSSVRMQAMINDLLSVSIISGNRSFKAESLQSLLEDVLVTLEYKIEQTGATIVQEEPLPMLNVIASQLRQLFQNLISNSLKFAHAGVRPVITIKSEYMNGDEPELGILPPDRKYLKITFSDNGIGFSNNYAAKIFAIFQRLHGKAEYEGTGIGLAVCRKIAEHHNGMICASGEVGVGAMFMVVLPV